MPSFWRAIQSLNPFPPPRTEMVCDVCGGFSSTRRCFVCSNSPAGAALHLAEVEQERLRHLLAQQEEEHRRKLEELRKTADVEEPDSLVTVRMTMEEASYLQLTDLPSDLAEKIDQAVGKWISNRSKSKS